MIFRTRVLRRKPAAAEGKEFTKQERHVRVSSLSRYCGAAERAPNLEQPRPALCAKGPRPQGAGPSCGRGTTRLRELGQFARGRQTIHVALDLNPSDSSRANSAFHALQSAGTVRAARGNLPGNVTGRESWPTLPLRGAESADRPYPASSAPAIPDCVRADFRSREVPCLFMLHASCPWAVFDFHSEFERPCA